MSENEDFIMSEDSNAVTSRSHQNEDIFGKYEAKDYGICYGIETDYTDEVDEDQHYSRKKRKFDPWQVFVGGAHRYPQETFNESVQHTFISFRSVFLAILLFSLKHLSRDFGFKRLF